MLRKNLFTCTFLGRGPYSINFLLGVYSMQNKRACQVKTRNPINYKSEGRGNFIFGRVGSQGQNRLGEGLEARFARFLGSFQAYITEILEKIGRKGAFEQNLRHVGPFLSQKSRLTRFLRFATGRVWALRAHPGPEIERNRPVLRTGNCPEPYGLRTYLF